MSGSNRGQGPPAGAPRGPRGGRGGRGQNQGYGRGGGNDTPGSNRGRQDNTGPGANQGGGGRGGPPNTGGNYGRPAQQGQAGSGSSSTGPGGRRNDNRPPGNSQPGRYGPGSQRPGAKFSKRDRFADEEQFFGQSQGVPQPDEDVTNLEDKSQADKAKKEAEMSRLITQAKGKPVQKEAAFPFRPSFGTQGSPVTLWANYFAIEPKYDSLKMIKYVIEVTRVGEGNPDPGRAQVMGKKREEIIRLALQKIANGIPHVTEYKSQVLALRKLEVSSGFVEIQHADPGRDTAKYRVKFDGPMDVSTVGLKEFIFRHVITDVNDQPYSKFEDVFGALGVLLGYYARSHPDIAAVGKGSYFPLGLANEKEAIGNPKFLEIIRGYFQSVRPATGRVLLNVNITHGIFRPEGKLDELLKRIGPHDRILARLTPSLSRARIKCTIYGQDGKPKTVLKTITGFARKTTNNAKSRVPRDYARPGEVEFLLEAPTTTTQKLPAGMRYGQFISVKDYYLKRYGKSINDNLPVINTGTALKPTYVPAEFCELVPGQPSRSKLSMDQAQEMILFACRSPYANATSISTIGRRVLKLDENEILDKFGIKVLPNLITVKARELPPPAIKYKAKKLDKTILPSDGSWNMNGVQFIKPGGVRKRWSWIYIAQDNLPSVSTNDHVKTIVMECMRWMIASMGVNLDQPALHQDGIRQLVRCGTLGETIEVLRARFSNEKKLPDIALVVVPDQQSTIYNAIKILADMEFGFHTVCITESTLLKTNKPGTQQYQWSTFANLALKFNLKTGGVNHTLGNTATLAGIAGGTSMVVGYDVIHPTNLNTDRADLPSQVGLVASIDKELGQWPCTYWNQQGKTEMADDKLVEAFVSRLDLWEAHNNQRLPQTILIFRDGVSEGQFKQVLDNELPKIKVAISRKYKPGREPRIAIIVSVKRHHTRFYPTNTRNMNSSSRNIRNGTVVDRGVTQARYWEFFLTAHNALQGTSKPARYIVLYDEVFRTLCGTNAVHVLEQLIHHMSYLFGRATKAVSICPPAYYADIVCTRARVHMAELFDAEPGTLTDEARARIQNKTVHPNLRDSMYYI